MMVHKWNRVFLLAAVVALAAAAAQADIIVDLVPVGNTGNAADDTGYGAVDYAYQIGTYEVTNAQWCEFLNAKAALGDSYNLYSTSMAGDYGGIDRSGSGTTEDPYVYTSKGGDSNWDNRPVNWVSFWDAARFCNWMHNGQGDGDTENGSYINIGNQETFARQANATWVVPTEDEWYKAAYYDGATGTYYNYPTGSNSTPSNDLVDPDGGNNANSKVGTDDYTIGSPYYATEVGEFENSGSPYGTFDQGGNMWEWNETAIDSTKRGVRGGAWDAASWQPVATNRLSSSPTSQFSSRGFRVASVASVPEPGSLIMLAGLFGLGIVMVRRNK